MHDYSITKKEFNDFVDKFGSELTIRNREASTNKQIDCSVYGAFCGVGITNIFFADNHIYPCCRFIGHEGFELGRYDTKLSHIEQLFKDKKYTKFEDQRYKNHSCLSVHGKNTIMHSEMS